ncbi:MAG: glycerol-3-phosphate acyltransferase [Dehalococcoidales bacterium]|nr:glycerol-3-phosphate acyltransferase [Dehalococcoidales bacterium]
MTNEALAIAIVIIGAYLLGSIPSPYIVGRLRKGIDIRQVGSRNMGAMNTFYNVGIAPGFLVLAADVGKGAAAMALAQWLSDSNLVMFLAGATVVLGHNFPVWLKFKGGKGGAPLVGVFIYLMPWGIPIGLSIFFVLLYFTRFPTLSYSIALLCFPFIAWLIHHNGDYVIFSLLMLLIPFVRYIPRIREMRAKGGSWGRVIKRRGLKDRL